MVVEFGDHGQWLFAHDADPSKMLGEAFAMEGMFFFYFFCFFLLWLLLLPVVIAIAIAILRVSPRAGARADASAILQSSVTKALPLRIDGSLAMQAQEARAVIPPLPRQRSRGVNVSRVRRDGPPTRVAYQRCSSS